MNYNYFLPATALCTTAAVFTETTQNSKYELATNIYCLFYSMLLLQLLSVLEVLEQQSKGPNSFPQASSHLCGSSCYRLECTSITLGVQLPEGLQKEKDVS